MSTSRRGFLSFMGGAVLATPAMAQTAGGVLLPVPQKIIGDRLVIEDLVLRGITIRNCAIESDGAPGIDIQSCYVVQTFAPPSTRIADSVVSTDGSTWLRINP